MNLEKKLILNIKSSLEELNREAYGERRHGNKELPPNLFHFKRYFENLFDAIYNLSRIEGQKYITQEDIRSIYDVEREISGDLSYYIEAKKPFSEISEECYLKIIGSLSCIIEKIKNL